MKHYHQKMFGLVFLAALAVLVMGAMTAIRRRQQRSLDLSSGSRMFCKRCGYNLRGLPGPQCPECSAEFDPADRSTFAEFDPHTQPRGSSALRWGLYCGALGFVLGFGGPIILTPQANQGPLLGIFITGPLGLVLGLIAGATRDIIRKTRQRRR